MTTPPDEADRLRALTDRLGVPGIVDVHTHFMPRAVMDKVWRYFDDVGPLTGMEWPVTYRLDERTRVERLHAFGVTAYSSLVYAHKPDMAEWLNGWAADFAATHPRCIPTATFHPEPSAPRYVDAAIGRGVGLFKAHVQVGDYDPNDPLLDGVWERIAAARVPVVLHAGSGPAPGRFTGPGPVAHLLERYPDLVLIIAHMGLPEYAEFLGLAAAYPDVYLDTTMAFTPFTERFAPFPDDLRPRLVTLGDRILFGSDFPNIPYGYVDAVDALVGLGLGDDWLRGVLHDNAARLYGLPSAD